MENQITHLEELKGKTISDFKLSSGDLWLKFTDDTFTVLEVNDVSPPFGYTRSEVNIHEYVKDRTDYTLVELNLISEEEYSKACLEEELQNRAIEEAREKEREERQRKEELKQLEILKTKYESGN